jgi:hypothetical protein
MDLKLRDKFVELWAKYFDGAELPITFYYTDDPAAVAPLGPAKGHMCIIGQLNRAFRGENLCFDHEAVGCFGGKRYLGFAHELRPGFEYFLSYGIPGKFEGERYKKSPELVLELMKKQAVFTAPARYIVFKRWDKLEAADRPEVAVFFAPPDVLSGLFTLSGFDESDTQAVIAPFGAGCGTIVQHPYAEIARQEPRGVLGMFDVSARPFVPSGTLSFSVPMTKFARMIDNMDESFLITESWAKVRKRIETKK